MTDVEDGGDFSIIQRKVSISNDSTNLTDIEDRLLAFQDQHEQIATPFEWWFTRANLDGVLAHCDLPAAA